MTPATTTRHAPDPAIARYHELKAKEAELGQRLSEVRQRLAPILEQLYRQQATLPVVGETGGENPIAAAARGLVASLFPKREAQAVPAATNDYAALRREEATLEEAMTILRPKLALAHRRYQIAVYAQHRTEHQAIGRKIADAALALARAVEEEHAFGRRLEAEDVDTFPRFARNPVGNFILRRSCDLRRYFGYLREFHGMSIDVPEFKRADEEAARRQRDLERAQAERTARTSQRPAKPELIARMAAASPANR